MEASDRQLLSRYIAGRDETAFRALVMRHLPLVHGVARRITANEDLARDVAQTTFLRLAERAAMISPDLPLPVWLHRVSRHLAIDLVRSEVTEITIQYNLLRRQGGKMTGIPCSPKCFQVNRGARRILQPLHDATKHNPGFEIKMGRRWI